jgi:hypothetical protein
MSLLRIRPLVAARLVRLNPGVVAPRWSCRPYSATRSWQITGYGEDPADLDAPQQKELKDAKKDAKKPTQAEKEEDPELCDHVVDEPSTVSSHTRGWADRSDLWPDEEEEQRPNLEDIPTKPPTKIAKQPSQDLGQSKRRLTTSAVRRSEEGTTHEAKPMSKEERDEAATKEKVNDTKETLMAAKNAAEHLKEEVKKDTSKVWDTAKKVGRKVKAAASEATKPIYFDEAE